jgi:hypothetical protein
VPGGVELAVEEVAEQALVRVLGRGFAAVRARCYSGENRQIEQFPEHALRRAPVVPPPPPRITADLDMLAPATGLATASMHVML